MVRAEILIRPDGEPRVTLEPDAAPPDEWVQLLLCYGAKLRWSLRGEPEWVREGFRSLSWETAVTWGADGAGMSRLDGLPSAPSLRLNAARFDLAAAHHERYIIQLYSDERGRGYPCGALPPNPQRANLVRHYISLAGAIASRLGEGRRIATQPLLLDWWYAMFDDGSGLGPERSLNEHIAIANRIFASRGDALESGLVSA